MSSKKHPHNGAPPPRQNPGSLWTDLNAIYASCIEMSQVPGQISSILRNKELINEIGDTGEIEKLGNRLVRNIKEFRTSLESLHERHLNKSGKCDKPDEWMEAINIHEGYLNWIESYQNTVHPSIVRILEISKNADNAIQARSIKATPASTQDSLT